MSDYFWYLLGYEMPDLNIEETDPKLLRAKYEYTTDIKQKKYKLNKTKVGDWSINLLLPEIKVEKKKKKKLKKNTKKKYIE